MKRILCIALAAMLLFAGCAKSEEAETTATAGAETEAAVERPAWAEDVALEVDDISISQTWLNYYYNDAVSGFYNQAMSTAASYAQYLGSSDYAQLISSLYGLDITKPLSQQTLGGEQTWADFFVENVVTAAKRDAAMTKLAREEGYELDADTQSSVDSLADNIADYANQNGYTSSDAYLRVTYGDCATLESYLEYYSYRVYADSYYQQKINGFAAKTFAEEEIRAQDEANAVNYDSFSFVVAFVPAEEDQTLIGELTKGAETDGLEVAAGQLSLESQVGSRMKAQEISEIFRTWVTDSERQEGDVTTIPTEEGAETAGTYVVQFTKHYDNAQPLVNVRHLLVKFETDSAGVQVVGTKEACLSKANSLLEEWKSGDATEDSFVELVKEYSEDGNASTGGMYENISPATSFVEPFLNWCIDESRKPGDVEIVETTYGYHIMYFSSFAEIIYRDQLITEDLRAMAQNQWYEGALEQVSAGEPDTSNLPLDKVLYAG